MSTEPSSSVAEALKILRQLQETNLVYIALIVASSWLIIKLIQKVLPWLATRAPSRFRPYILPLVPVLRLVTVIAAILLIVLEVVEAKFESLVAFFGAFGVAMGFALKDYASSLTAGIVAIYEHAYRPGDWVRIGGAYGEVQSVDARALRIVTLDDTLVTIPHKRLWDQNIYNANNARRELQCIADFYLHPRHDGVLVSRKLHDVALASPYLQIEMPIIVAISEKPWCTHYRLKAYPIDGRDQVLFIGDLTTRGKAALAELGVEPAMCPQLLFEGGREG